MPVMAITTNEQAAMGALEAMLAGQHGLALGKLGKRV